jgi:hypothetical protein
MNINQFFKTFPDEATCPKYLEKTIWISWLVDHHHLRGLAGGFGLFLGRNKREKNFENAFLTYFVT